MCGKNIKKTRTEARVLKVNSSTNSLNEKLTNF